MSASAEQAGLTKREPLLVRKWSTRLATWAVGWLVATGKIGPDTGPVAQAATGVLATVLAETATDFYARASVSPKWKAAKGLWDRSHQRGEHEAL